MAKKMLKSHHLAILAFMLALGIATPIIVATLSEDESARAAHETQTEEAIESMSQSTETAADTDANTDAPLTEAANTPATNAETVPVTVNTFDELQAALEKPDQPTITLGADIELSEPLTIARSLTLDLSTYQLTAAAGVRGALIVRQGDVTINGATGSSIAAQSGVAIWVYGSKTATDTNFTHLTIGKDVLVAASNSEDASYGIAVNRFDSSNNVAYGVKIDLNGQLKAYNGITILGNVQHTDNAPVINIGSDASITAQGTDDSMAIYAAGYGVWTVGTANLVGSSTLGVKAGQFTFNGTTMTANGTHQSNVETSNNGIAGSGATFQIENNSVYAGGIQITIDGGKYTSQNSNVFYEYSSTARSASALEKLTINSGTFEAGPSGAIFNDVNTAAVTLTGGVYNKAIAKEYLGNNQQLVEKDGVWTLQNTSTDQPNPDPTPSDNKDDEGNEDSKPEQKPGSNTPGTGVHNSANHISAIATTTTAIIIGALVFLAFVLRYLIRRHSNKQSAAKSASKPQSASRTKTSQKATARTKATGKTSTQPSSSAKRSAKAIKASSKPARSQSSHAKSRKTAKTAKTRSKSSTKR